MVKCLETLGFIRPGEAQPVAILVYPLSETATKLRQFAKLASSLRDLGHIDALRELKPTAINFNGYAIRVSQ